LDQNDRFGGFFLEGGEMDGRKSGGVEVGLTLFRLKWTLVCRYFPNNVSLRPIQSCSVKVTVVHWLVLGISAELYFVWHTLPDKFALAAFVLVSFSSTTERNEVGLYPILILRWIPALLREITVKIEQLQQAKTPYFNNDILSNF
jgi:hypothetical protein